MKKCWVATCGKTVLSIIIRTSYIYMPYASWQTFLIRIPKNLNYIRAFWGLIPLLFSLPFFRGALYRRDMQFGPEFTSWNLPPLGIPRRCTVGTHQKAQEEWDENQRLGKIQVDFYSAKRRRQRRRLNRLQSMKLRKLALGRWQFPFEMVPFFRDMLIFGE